MAKRSKSKEIVPGQPAEYVGLVRGISELLDSARRSAARSVNGIMTSAYWDIGRRIVEFEQGGMARAEYGKEVLARLAVDLSAKQGRGFSKSNLASMRNFYQGWEICRTPSGKFEAWVRLSPDMRGNSNIFQTPSGKLEAGAKFPTASGELVPVLVGTGEICPTASGKLT